MKLLFLILIVYLAYRAGKSWLKRNLQVPGQGSAAGGAIDDVMVQDPVCGIHFPRREGVELHHDGQTYLFCSAECRDKFLADRGKKT